MQNTLPTAQDDPGRRWAAAPRGRKLTAIERAEIARLLPDLFGRHFLQIGVWGDEGDWLASAAMPHRAVLAMGPQAGAQARIDALRLPLLSKSVDAILLPHTLEFAPSPHTLLREVTRVLSERGRLLVLGFNPWSALAARRFLGMAPAGLPQAAHYYSAGRVGDWLNLLDFQIDSVRRFGTGFPWLPPRTNGQPFSPAALLQPLSDAWLISARRRVIPISRIGRSPRAQIRPLTIPAAARSDAERSGPSP